MIRAFATENDMHSLETCFVDLKILLVLCMLLSSLFFLSALLMMVLNYVVFRLKDTSSDPLLTVIEERERLQINQ